MTGTTNGAGLDGRAALVIGGSRGIGAAIARRLAAEGADVALTYASASARAAEVVDAIEATGRRGVAIEADSADADAVTAAVDRAAAELGRLDILVNNARIFPTGPVEETPLADVDRTLAVHVRAAFVAIRAALAHIGPGGRIISIGSCFAERVPYPGVSLYAMSKAALLGLTKGVARDVGERGITATVVHPGSTDTEMNPADGPDADAERELIALGHYADPDDIAATVSHLAGEGGRYITGTAIAVDGGFAA
ncbi:MAG TPA: SDR family oxidoreductase [Solirubrobacterales bacterium]|nr:SDR family oxidoreductase [Solirubrobacterales bacterium]